MTEVATVPTGLVLSSRLLFSDFASYISAKCFSSSKKNYEFIQGWIEDVEHAEEIAKSLAKGGQVLSQPYSETSKIFIYPARSTPRSWAEKADLWVEGPNSWLAWFIVSKKLEEPPKEPKFSPVRSAKPFTFFKIVAVKQPQTDRDHRTSAHNTNPSKTNKPAVSGQEPMKFARTLEQQEELMTKLMTGSLAPSVAPEERADPKHSSAMNVESHGQPVQTGRNSRSGTDKWGNESRRHDHSKEDTDFGYQNERRDFKRPAGSGQYLGKRPANFEISAPTTYEGQPLGRQGSNKLLNELTTLRSSERTNYDSNSAANNGNSYPQYGGAEGQKLDQTDSRYGGSNGLASSQWPLKGKRRIGKDPSKENTRYGGPSRPQVYAPTGKLASKERVPELWGGRGRPFEGLSNPIRPTEPLHSYPLELSPVQAKKSLLPVEPSTMPAPQLELDFSSTVIIPPPNTSHLRAVMDYFMSKRTGD